MVGKRKFIKNCLSQAAEDYVPKNNFYRRLKPLLDLTFLHKVFTSEQNLRKRFSLAELPTLFPGGTFALSSVI
jgi:hypothetical protein